MVHWAEPKMIVEVGFTEVFTTDGFLRHPSLVSVWGDEVARDVMLEVSRSVAAPVVIKQSRRQRKGVCAMERDEMKMRLGVELCRTYKVLGGKSDLLGILCSYGDTLEDWEVIERLKEWNDLEEQRAKGIAARPRKPH